MKGNTMTLRSVSRARDSRPEQAPPKEAAERFLQSLEPVKKNLYNFILKSLNFSHDTDDIYQETLLKAFRYFHSFDPERSFKTWLFTIAHNLVKDHFKSSRSLVLLENVDGLAVDVDASIPHDVRDIYRAAGALSPRHREVFFLYYYNEFTISEIVDITNLTKVNVKFILHRARKTVKGMMEARQ
jgi:RNA polymerase sigma-70 factor (ECF subfamily)